VRERDVLFERDACDSITFVTTRSARRAMRSSRWFAVVGAPIVLCTAVAVAPTTVSAADKGGVVITNYAAGRGQPQNITSGPDGALWYTDAGIDGPTTDVIWHMTKAGVVTSFSDPTIHQAGEITAGPDGAMWFTNESTNSIGRIASSGAVTNFIATGIDFPCGITTGPDGALRRRVSA
jgi:hypothetical protein